MTCLIGTAADASGYRVALPGGTDLVRLAELVVADHLLRVARPFGRVRGGDAGQAALHHGADVLCLPRRRAAQLIVGVRIGAVRVGPRAEGLAVGDEQRAV